MQNNKIFATKTFQPLTGKGATKIHIIEDLSMRQLAVLENINLNGNIIDNLGNA